MLDILFQTKFPLSDLMGFRGQNLLIHRLQQLVRILIIAAIKLHKSLLTFYLKTPCLQTKSVQLNL